MNQIERIRKTSNFICKIGTLFQNLFGILAGIFFITLLILSFLRDTLNRRILESQTDFEFRNMGWLAERLANKGKPAEAAIAFLISCALLSLMVTAIMHFIVKIFKRLGSDYSPFLPEVVKDLKIVSVLATLLILRNSIGMGIISGFIFWGIVQLYEYGCDLQNQADETL